jgi:hypothetical protein
MNAMNERSGMTCEEFELLGLDSSRDSSLGEEARQRAVQHVRSCTRCAGLTASWKAARETLVTLRKSTQQTAASSRVETRLLQQFRLRYQSRQERRALRFAAWALAAAAVAVCAAGVWDWHKWRQHPIADGTISESPAATYNSGTANDSRLAGSDLSEALIANNETGEFTQLPGSSSLGTEDGAIVRVGMQRAALGAFGLPVDEEGAGDWIQVDVLVAGDGSPQAVRLPQ